MPQHRSPNRISLLAAFLVLPLSAVEGLAQQPPAMPMQHAMPGMTGSGEPGPSSKAFREANEKMMKGMDVPLSGDADRDFVASMIPHHAGAIDMAKIELQYGKDAKLRALAQAIVAAQDKEIAEMKAWLAAHP